MSRLTIGAGVRIRKPMPVPDLLRRLLEAAGPSGHEEPPARVWREAAGAFADVTSDTLGNSFARVRAGDGAPVLAVVGHIDEIGVAITHVDENGLLSYSPVGGFRPEVLLGQRVRIAGLAGEVRGVVGRRRLPPDRPRDERATLEHKDLHIDVGAASRAEAESLVRVGDVAVWDGEPFELPNERLVSRALDNRLGTYVALEAARRVADAGDLQIDFVAVAAVAEEVGYFGARAAAFGLDPHVALAIDVTHAVDVPGGDPRLAGKIEVGSGVAITRGPMINAHVLDLLVTTAEHEGIPYSFEVAARVTQTDADKIHIARAGIPTGLLSIPVRYMHSPCELVSLEDLEATIRLVAAFARRLTREHSFIR
jgi:endoglucanase